MEMSRGRHASESSNSNINCSLFRKYFTKPPAGMTDSLLKYKGIADILVAAILSVKPDLIYGCLPARVIASYTGLVSDHPVVVSWRVSYSSIKASVSCGHSSWFQPSNRLHGSRRWSRSHSRFSLWTRCTTTHMYVSLYVQSVCIPHKFDSCNESDLGDTGIPHMCHSLGIGAGERHVADDQSQPHAIQYSTLRSRLLEYSKHFTERCVIEMTVLR
jgi:hypothetical protein